MGILHADIKLANIMVEHPSHHHSTSSGVLIPKLRINDYGTSLKLPYNGKEMGGLVLTHHHHHLPPDHRIPPELIRDDGTTDRNHPVGTPLDIWALGCLLWQIVTRRIVEEDTTYNRYFFSYLVRFNNQWLRQQVDEAISLECPQLRNNIKAMLSFHESERPTAQAIFHDVSECRHTTDKLGSGSGGSTRGTIRRATVSGSNVIRAKMSGGGGSSTNDTTIGRKAAASYIGTKAKYERVQSM